ncbi:hypothetical protein [Microcoleus sp. S13C4]|uniref:hypothetical protein n=1 Tax=Microcoleus sp. S13C4 TaxID=3055410 RepID=UPI002FD0C930
MSWFSETASSVSDALSEVDPTNPNSAVSDALRAVDPTLLVGDTQALLEPMAMPLARNGILHFSFKTADVLVKSGDRR